MLREKFLHRLIDESYLEIYLSSHCGARIYWPWRMQTPKEASARYRGACEKYIIDSDFADEEVKNGHVLDCAFKIDAEIAVLSDVYQDIDGTIDAVLKGVELYEDHAFEGDLLIPLQQPYDECYASLSDTGHYFGLGGIKDKNANKKLELIKQFRETVGYAPNLHGFGMGVSDELAYELQKEPRLLDSIDYSTPIQSNIMGVDNGKERTSVVAMRAATQLIEDLRRVTPNVTHTIREKNQNGLEAYQ